MFVRFYFFIFFLDFFFRFFSLSYFRFFPGRFDTSGFMIRLSVPEIEGGTLSVTEKEKKKDWWSWGILGSGFHFCENLSNPICFQIFLGGNH